MANLSQLYDNTVVYCAEWRKAVGERNEALANIFEQMAAYNRQRIAEVMKEIKAGGRRETK